MQYILKPITNLKSHNTEPGPNSNPNCPDVDLENIEVWESFMMNGEIESMLKDPTVAAVFNEEYTQEELDMFTWGSSPETGRRNEKQFEKGWSTITDALNVILEKIAAAVQGVVNPICVKMGDGDSATKKAPGRKWATQNIKADLAGYEAIPDSGQYVGNAADEIYNRIPGDAKLFRKIRRSMLPPDGLEFSLKNENECQKVINQIHNYMDAHEARYGYIVTDHELIFFRRRGEQLPSGWGHLDISRAIRHDLDARNDETGGTPTTKAILIYFHMVVALDDSQWYLPSAFEMIKKRTQSDRRVNMLPRVVTNPVKITIRQKTIVKPAPAIRRSLRTMKKSSSN